MFPVEAFQRTVEQFVAILRQLEIPFHITSGSISSAYGEPRLTQDIDIVISPDVVATGTRIDRCLCVLRFSPNANVIATHSSGRPVRLCV